MFSLFSSWESGPSLCSFQELGGAGDDPVVTDQLQAVNPIWHRDNQKEVESEETLMKTFFLNFLSK